MIKGLKKNPIGPPKDPFLKNMPVGGLKKDIFNFSQEKSSRKIAKTSRDRSEDRLNYF